jgi:hypothetical protein
MKKSAFHHVMMPLLMFTMIGCGAGIPQLRVESRKAEMEILQGLREGWDDYDVFYMSWPGNEPAGILFDPRQDGKRLVAGRWSKVPDQESLVRLIQAMKRQHQFQPRLYRIMGPEGDFFGFLYALRNDVGIRILDDTRIQVFEVKPPPAPAP